MPEQQGYRWPLVCLFPGNGGGPKEGVSEKGVPNNSSFQTYVKKIQSYDAFLEGGTRHATQSMIWAAAVMQYVHALGTSPLDNKALIAASYRRLAANDGCFNPVSIASLQVDRLSGTLLHPDKGTGDLYTGVICHDVRDDMYINAKNWKDFMTGSVGGAATHGDSFSNDATDSRVNTLEEMSGCCVYVLQMSPAIPSLTQQQGAASAQPGNMSYMRYVVNTSGVCTSASNVGVAALSEHQVSVAAARVPIPDVAGQPSDVKEKGAFVRVLLGKQ